MDNRVYYFYARVDHAYPTFCKMLLPQKIDQLLNQDKNK